MSVPAEIPGIGSTGQRLRQNPRFDPMKAGFGTEEYFVWSRFDGQTSVRDLVLMTGLPVERAIAIVRQLRTVGAILLPGETTAPAAPAAPAPTRGLTAIGPRAPVPGPLPPPRAVPPPVIAAASTVSGVGPGIPVPPRAPIGSGARVAAAVDAGAGPRPRASTLPPPGTTSVADALPELDHPTTDEAAALAEDVDLHEVDRRRILVGQRLVADRDPWALIGVAKGADKRTLKRAFFERSKLFHPDRYFGKRSGSFAGRLHEVFEAITNAHDELTGAHAGRRREPMTATAPQTPAEYAAELFDRACVAEVSGDPAQALKLFAAAVKLDAQARYLRRAASCALAANELRVAEDYAKKAAAREGSDPSTARILARVLRAVGKLDEAEEVLIMALAMKNENDTLGSELVADLRVVRELLRR